MRLAELVAEQRIGAVVEAAVAMCGGNRPTGSNYRWGPVRRCFRINDLALASLTFASWNQTAAWLRQIEGIRVAA
jgi:hypothetical protein